MSLNSTLYTTGMITFGLVAIFYIAVSDGSRFQTESREVLVREVGNGFIVSLRTTNNPYAVKEAVAKDMDEAAWQVKEFLKGPLPEPRWGK